MERMEPNPSERWGLQEREEPKAGGEGVKVLELEGRGKGGGGAWLGMLSKEGDSPAVSDTVPQTWTNAARRTSARAASVPTPTALSSASVLQDTALAQTSPPASVRGLPSAWSLSPLPPGLPHLSPPSASPLLLSPFPFPATPASLF